LTIKQLRDFHQKISDARSKVILKGMASVKPIIWDCMKNIEYQLNRGIIPVSFGQFMKHHLSLAEQDERNLEGFYQHLDSIVCYFPKIKNE